MVLYKDIIGEWGRNIAFAACKCSTEMQALTLLKWMVTDIKIDWRQKDAQGQTILFVAASKGYNLLVKTLHHNDFNMNLVDSQLQNAIFKAVVSNKLETVQLLASLGCNHDFVDIN